MLDTKWETFERSSQRDEMTFVGGLGYTLIALGPAIALFFTVIIGKPFLILTLIVSIFSWLISLVLIAGVWRAFLPSESNVWVYIPLLLSAVCCQEAARRAFWHLYLKVEDILNKIAVRLSKPRLHTVDKLEIALAFGFGHGLAHVIFFCLALLTPSFGPGTFYVPGCTQMSFFLMAALTGLSFLIIHTFSMVIAFDGHADGNKSQQIFAPGMHFLATFATLVNLAEGGCVYGVSATLSCAVITSAVCWKIQWDKAGADPFTSSNLNRTHH
ncbi:hypothetical protein R1flu_009674 [Riccia fluitans]|uniref:Gamma-secretase subunit APH1-like n=1 Tax=Riccia fluitans TaxID=41844 RepID=A0ABD1Z2T7_9MARC